LTSKLSNLEVHGEVGASETLVTTDECDIVKT
jgi:hypothetical protein